MKKDNIKTDLKSSLMDFTHFDDFFKRYVYDPEGTPFVKDHHIEYLLLQYIKFHESVYKLTPGDTIQIVNDQEYQICLKKFEDEVDIIKSEYDKFKDHK